MTGPLAILFHRLGPYHHARLEAAGRHGAVAAVEYSSVDSTYAWKPVEASGAFPVHTMFKGVDVESEQSGVVRSRVAEVLREIAPGAVAIPGWSASASLFALEWCLREGVPAVLMSESQAVDARRSVASELVKKRIVSRFSAALVGGARHRDYLESLGMSRERIFTGYDVVDNAHFSVRADAARASAEATRNAFGLPERYFLASARFVEKKNLERLVEAYGEYRRRAREKAWKLVLLGDGPLRPRILEVRDRLELREDVLLPGFKQYDELPAYYGLARAFVHASTVEQWGLVVNEAMAAGLPVLVSNRCGCAPELVHDGVNGYAFDPFRPLELADRMSALAADEPALLAMGRASQEIAERWTPERFGTGIQDAARSAAALHPRRSGLIDLFLLQGLARR